MIYFNGEKIKINIADEIEYRQIGTESLLFCKRKGRVWSLNSTATAIWNIIARDEGSEVIDLIDDLSNVVDLSGILRNDVIQSIQHILDFLSEEEILSIS